VKVVSRKEVHRVCKLVELGRPPVDDQDDDVQIESFDPTIHAILCNEPTVVSYMRNNPKYILGERANAISPTFTSALVWWTCE
jgi:hypothetical protein